MKRSLSAGIAIFVLFGMLIACTSKSGDTDSEADEANHEMNHAMIEKETEVPGIKAVDDYSRRRVDEYDPSKRLKEEDIKLTNICDAIVPQKHNNGKNDPSDDSCYFALYSCRDEAGNYEEDPILLIP